VASALIMASSTTSGNLGPPGRLRKKRRQGIGPWLQKFPMLCQHLINPMDRLKPRRQTERGVAIRVSDRVPHAMLFSSQRGCCDVCRRTYRVLAVVLRAPVHHPGRSASQDAPLLRR
jgi:hypothetical protein